MSKYFARQVKEDGYTFASQAEYRYYCDLKILLKNKLIEGLIVHPKFTAIVNGTKICNIILDFQYFDKETNRLCYVDVKGLDMPISKLKRKLLEALYPEVTVTVVGPR